MSELFAEGNTFFFEGLRALNYNFKDKKPLFFSKDSDESGNVSESWPNNNFLPQIVHLLSIIE